MLHKTRWLACLCLVLTAATLVSAQQQRKRRPNPALAPVEDVAGLPRVLLLGDSISIGYTLPVRKLLDGVANVHRPQANCGPTTRGVEQLEAWLGKGKWDVIHFNFGLHDLKYLKPDGKSLGNPADSASRQQVPPDQYEKNLEELVERLEATGAKLIWCSTTPVPQGAQGRIAGDAEKYNAIAARVMERHDIPTDDLYAFAQAKLEELQRPKNVHFTPEGSQALAEQVAESIREALPE